MPTSVDLLPEDVLREIFTYSVASESQMKYSRPRDILVLTHVCSRWRQIALSMPYLWSTIHVSQCIPNVQFMHEWLSRAAAVPKTLFLKLAQERKEKDDLEPIHPIFASYPFQKLFVFPDYLHTDEDEDEDETMFVLPNQLLEHLEELHLNESRAMFPHDAKLPNLQRLSIASDWEPGNFQRYSPAIPWSQIRHLTLSRPNVETHLLFSVLKQCVRLEYCKIKYPRDHHRAPTPFHNITLPNLLSLELSTFDHSWAHIFGAECMRRLIIPSVNVLQLSLWNLDTSVYSRVIEHSGGMPRLHTLTLREHTADIGILLKLLPHLESLTVSRDLGTRIWQDLSMGRLGPRLKHITSPVSAVDVVLDLLKIRYQNAMRSSTRQQHDGGVCQPQITHFQSATFVLSCDRSKFQVMVRHALDSNGRGPYQCLQWTFDGISDRTYTLDDI